MSRNTEENAAHFNDLYNNDRNFRMWFMSETLTTSDNYCNDSKIIWVRKWNRTIVPPNELYQEIEHFVWFAKCESKFRVVDSYQVLNEKFAIWKSWEFQKRMDLFFNVMPKPQWPIKSSTILFKYFDCDSMNEFMYKYYYNHAVYKKYIELYEALDNPVFLKLTCRNISKRMIDVFAKFPEDIRNLDDFMSLYDYTLQVKYSNEQLDAIITYIMSFPEHIRKNKHFVFAVLFCRQKNVDHSISTELFRADTLKCIDELYPIYDKSTKSIEVYFSYPANYRQSKHFAKVLGYKIAEQETNKKLIDLYEGKYFSEACFDDIPFTHESVNIYISCIETNISFKSSYNAYLVWKILKARKNEESSIESFLQVSSETVLALNEIGDLIK